MTQKQNLYYPSGKPLCIYDEQHQVVYKAHGKYRVRSITDEKYSLEYKDYRPDDTLLSQKTLDENSTTEGVIRYFAPGGAVTEENFFVFDPQSYVESTYLDHEKKKIFSIRNLNPDLSLALYTEYYPSGFIALKAPHMDNLEHGKSFYYADEKKERITHISNFDRGNVRNIVHLSKLGKPIQKNIYADISTGDFIARIKDEDGYEEQEYKDNKIISSLFIVNGLATEKTFYGENEKILKCELYEYNSAYEPNLCTYTVCNEVSAWHKNGSPAKGTVREYDLNMHLVANSDFVYSAKKEDYRQNGLNIVRGLGIEVIRKNEVVKTIYCKVKEEDGFLLAYTKLAEKEEQIRKNDAMKNWGRRVSASSKIPYPGMRFPGFM